MNDFLDYEPEDGFFKQDKPRQLIVTVTGVTHSNADGESRQDILKACRKGDEVFLRREYDNPYDKDAVAIFTRQGKQMGYINRQKQYWIPRHLDRDYKVKATIINKFGGPGILGLFFQSLRKNYGCAIKIVDDGYDVKQQEQYRLQNEKIEKKIQRAQKHEKTNPLQAIKGYREAIADIKAMDFQCRAAAYARHARYPIDRLSLLLDKNGQQQEAYEEILIYEAHDNKYELTKSERESVEKRKARLSRKLKT